MSRTKITTQTFRSEIKSSVALIVGPGAPAMASPPSWSKSLYVTASGVGDMMVTVGPLDNKKFQVGDRIKIIVQRIGKRQCLPSEAQAKGFALKKIHPEGKLVEK